MGDGNLGTEDQQCTATLSSTLQPESRVAILVGLTRPSLPKVEAIV